MPKHTRTSEGHAAEAENHDKRFTAFGCYCGE